MIGAGQLSVDIIAANLKQVYSKLGTEENKSDCLGTSLVFCRANLCISMKDPRYSRSRGASSNEPMTAAPLDVNAAFPPSNADKTSRNTRT